jgi:predicted RNA-binding protein
MTVWCLTTSADNFAKTAELGWKVQGIKSRREKTAKEIAPGDKVIYYVTKHIAFGAIVEVTSTYFEDHDPIWTSKPGEDYPWRFEITPEIVIDDPTAWVPAEELREQLEFPRKWPPEHWKLAFQGNIRAWPESDYAVVRNALEAAR